MPKLLIIVISSMFLQHVYKKSDSHLVAVLALSVYGCAKRRIFCGLPREYSPVV
jgi:hypothetical protein